MGSAGPTCTQCSKRLNRFGLPSEKPVAIGDEGERKLICGECAGTPAAGFDVARRLQATRRDFGTR